ncbi:P-loop NTPase fold protein [Streptococcus sanguinis]|jgi:KAP family P-loop domain|uniref:P-loop NTPase fold protein n=1 Tax=Streptococcus sanguinis TaxID=1305 RepID=UPI002284E8A0|nr:P-loop NTPase fold protein [Streptococcus sanguinis]MCY7019385.1 KAP family NTPase [Streptococcus sanguinis]
MSKNREINSIEEDRFGLENHVQEFYEQYIDSDYTGTVLLSGNWGVGKSSYINLVENYAIKNKEIKFIRLNFWSFSGEQTIYRYIFTNLYPRINIILNWLAPIVVALFFLLNNFINWMFSNPVNWNLLAPLLILTSIVTVFQDKAIKEGWYESSVTKKFKTKKQKLTIVVDDFDRIPSNIRDDIYAVLSNLNAFSNHLIIIIGEYERLKGKSEESLFIQKIIDKIIIMPHSMSSRNVWYHFRETLESMSGFADISETDIILLGDIQNAFIVEQRNMRDSIHLLEVFEKEYANKKEKVNFSELLLICYIYEFHHGFYNEIVHDKSKFYRMTNTNYSEIITDLINKALKNKEGNVFRYSSFTEEQYFERYLVGFNVNNSISKDDIQTIFKSDKATQINLLRKIYENEQQEEFYNLLSKEYLDINKLLHDNNFKNITEENYSSLLTNLISLNAEINGFSLSNFSLDYLENIIYKIRDILQRKFAVMPAQQFENYILKIPKLDLSGKLTLLPRFVPRRDGISEEHEILVNKTFREADDFEILSVQNPYMIFLFSKTLRGELQKAVASKINSIFEFDNSTFYQFVMENLVTTYTSYPNSKPNKRELLDLDNISYNEDFKNKFLKKINQLEEDQKNNLDKLILNAIKIKHNVR